MNTLQAVIPGTSAGNVLLVVSALFIVFYDRMWKKLPMDSLAAYT